ncbi:hypothetical protein SADUNF_Sadunf14G0041600 [Salix dunnii]|uniref:Uncharacterized protein n=1 Tax=Salix dunnii TaxID=1413687 RepID=A0A835JGA4_9ROSI|nr:hypothetical protein SADUNF_Sadunf14G0041600 [Salix dunnii]
MEPSQKLMNPPGQRNPKDDLPGQSHRRSQTKMLGCRGRKQNLRNTHDRDTLAEQTLISRGKKC